MALIGGLFNWRLLRMCEEYQDSMFWPILIVTDGSILELFFKEKTLVLLHKKYSKVKPV